MKSTTKIVHSTFTALIVTSNFKVGVSIIPAKIGPFQPKPMRFTFDSLELAKMFILKFATKGIIK